MLSPVVRQSGNFPTGSDTQQASRIGVRVHAADSGVGGDGLTGNDLVPLAVDPRPRDRFGLHDFDVNAQGELDCNELYTFRCGHNQCLPIPVWCDGRADCDDKTGQLKISINQSINQSIKAIHLETSKKIFYQKNQTLYDTLHLVKHGHWMENNNFIVQCL